MKLEEYLDKYQTPVAALARKAGVCPTTIRYILYGKDIRLSVAKAVADATHGEVSLEDLAARKKKGS